MLIRGPAAAIRFDYSEVGGKLSLCRTDWLWMGRRILAITGVWQLCRMGAISGAGIQNPARTLPELRAHRGFSEWIGWAGKPTTSRIIPVTVLDGGELQDGASTWPGQSRWRWPPR